jgi:hypothetical protein
VLAIGPKEDDGRLRAIKIRKAVGLINILWHVEDPAEYNRDTSSAKLLGISHRFFLLRY